MRNREIKYPIILVRNRDDNLYVMTRALGLISKGGDSFYRRSMKLIDKNGYVFKLKSSKDLGRAGLLNSIRYFQPMQQVKFELIKEQQLTLDELKKFVLAHIKRKPKHRLSLGTLEMIEDWVNEKKTIPELIKMFR